MKWLRIDANMTRNPKVTAVKADGLILYLRGLSYCAEHETDGLIPAHVITSLVSDFVALELWSVRRRKPVDKSTPDGASLSPLCRQVVAPVTRTVTGQVADASDGDESDTPPGGMTQSAFDRRRQRLVKRMVDAGLWHETPHGFEVNDYLKYQPERSEIEDRDERRREADRERKRRERARKRGVPLSPACRNVTPVTVPTVRGYPLRDNPPYQDARLDGVTPALGGAGAPIASTAEEKTEDTQAFMDEHGPHAIIRRLTEAKRMPGGNL